MVIPLVLVGDWRLRSLLTLELRTVFRMDMAEIFLRDAVGGKASNLASVPPWVGLKTPLLLLSSWLPLVL